MNAKTKWALWTGGAILLIFYPKVLGIYYSNVFVMFAIYALFAVSLNLLLGFTGLLSFGHAMYFGTGAYGTALALKHIQGLPLIPAILAGVLAACLLALCIAPLVVRVSGNAFAMMHLAFGQLMFVLALKLRHITGGEDGIGGFEIPPLSIPGIASWDMTDPILFFYFAVAVIAGSLWVLWFFTKTPFGQIMVSVRDNAKRVNYLGFRVPHTKAVIYVISGSFAGVAGAVYVLFQNLIAAGDAYHIFQSFAPVMITMVGGVGHFAGPICGAAIFGLLEELTSRYTDRVFLVTGLVLVLVIMYAPYGFTGWLTAMRMRWAARKMAYRKLGGSASEHSGNQKLVSRLQRTESLDGCEPADHPR
ncbi:MAG: branched-chain amino acid ABC transporter permease [Desulfobacteraceae bacterium]|nr:MAG: branched-chain amino acid ABC transporter permease [Desulfobacteraceae bacterium]